MTAPSPPAPSPTALGLGALFARFLRFGSLAFGGPVAQIGMLQHELVDKERWVDTEQFRRVFALYQVLPGPEAHELCVWFGTVARGRLGGLVAGLGFMLPGLTLVLLASWLYTRVGHIPPALLPAFAGMQAAAFALLVRATHRIGSRVLVERTAWALALLCCAGELANAPFALGLAGAGTVAALRAQGRSRGATAAGVAWIGLTIWCAGNGAAPGSATGAPATGALAAAASPGLGTLLASGLRAGLLSFGGAYTAIPYLREDATGAHGWMTGSEFLDGLALCSVIPAPLIVLGTFVGFLGGGLLGALATTAAIFAPAFAIGLTAHRLLERLLGNPRLRACLDGVGAGVVGLIAATAIDLAPLAVGSLPRAVIALAAVAALCWLRGRWSVLWVVLTAAAAGWCTG